MRSTIAVYNTALARLGGNQLGRENSPDNNSTEASLCRTMFPHVLDMSLSHCEWSFARKAVNLGLKVDTDPVHPDYPYRYAIPSDCIRPMRLLGSRYSHCGNETPYEIDGQDILTVISPATLVYVRRITDPSAWPPSFADAVAWGLAAELATALINDVNRQQFYGEKARDALEHAAAIELNSQHRQRKPSAWLLSRGATCL